MIPANEIENFINKLSDIKSGKYSEYISKTRDIFDTRLYSFTNKTQNWLFGAVIGEIGANTFDHNFTFQADGKGYSFGLSDFRHDGCFCILSCKEL